MFDEIPTPDPLLSLTDHEIREIFQEDLAREEMMADYERKHPSKPADTVDWL